MVVKKYMIVNSAEDASSIIINLNEEEFKLVKRIIDGLNDNSDKYAPSISIAEIAQKEKEVIWTMAYFPFAMGGDVNRPICTTVEVHERKIINGFEFFSVKSPRGNLLVCERQTCGIVANSFERMEKNMQGVSIETLQAQIDEAKPMRAKAEAVAYDVFFQLYKA